MEQVRSTPTLTTNTFVLCELVSLQWHVYRLAVTPNKKELSSKSTTKQTEDTALTLFHQRLQQRNVLCILNEDQQRQEEDSNAYTELWVFIVNGMQSTVPVEPPVSVCESTAGSWTNSTNSLDQCIQKHFYGALSLALHKKLVAREEFVLTADHFYEPNDAKFIFRCPSLTQLNHAEVYLNEVHPMLVFQLHFQLLVPSKLLTVAVDVVKRDDSFSSSDTCIDELGDLRCSWERLVGLPSQKDHSVVDVWHMEDELVPRIVADIKYSNVLPWFRTVSKRRHKRRMDTNDGSGNEDELKREEHDDDADEEDDDDNTQETEVETDELLRRPVACRVMKAKQKRDSTNSTGNDESIVPVTPDPHVNTPKAACPIVRMTLPREDILQLHVDFDVKSYKRRRRDHKMTLKKEANYSFTFKPIQSNGINSSEKAAPCNGMKKIAVDAPQSVSMANYSVVKSETTFTRHTNDTKSPSVDVSLVESLSHDKQQEMFLVQPLKTHPSLQALQDYVDEEAKALDKRLTASFAEKVKYVPNAESFIPLQLRATMGWLSIDESIAEQLHRRLYLNRCKYWKSEYTHRHHLKGGRQVKKEQQRRLLLNFDQNAFEEQRREESLKMWNSSKRTKLRDDEISLGIQMSASDALVTWRQEPIGISTWSAHTNSHISAASAADKNDLMDRVQPYLQCLVSLLKKNEKHESDESTMERDRRWMSFEDYTQATSYTCDDVLIDSVEVEEPKVCISTLESSLHVESTLISEYLLRDFRPVAAPKPVDYVIICPHSPSQWLASLALSYFTCFRSMYGQCHMGDLAPINLSNVEKNHYANVDVANGLLLVNCAKSMVDPFANFRAAGKVLSPVMSSGATKKKQAFSRSAVANVVFIVAPFRRSDVKHRMWVLGAFSSGLFGSESTFEASEWRQSVTIEMVYLEDLYEVDVNPSPFVLMPSCFGLYNRVCENIRLKPIDGGANAVGRSHFICERLYHLADWRVETPSFSQSESTKLPHIYGGYLLSKDGKWIAGSCTDAIGSVLETYMILVREDEDGKGLENALLEMMQKMLHFYALFGEKSVFVITRLSGLAGVSSLNVKELSAWEQLRSSRMENLIPMTYEPHLSCILLVQLTAASYDEVQLRDNPSSTVLYFSDNLGLAIMSPRNDTAARDSSRALYNKGNNAWKITTMNESMLAENREERVLKVTLMLVLQSSKDGPVIELISSSMMNTILRDFQALSYLTMHPITMERQSPLPYHLAAISRMSCELQVLETQLTTDPLQMR
ncbi:hypothetical protein CCR75_008883 [Bremia lactucae]|uniref:Mediator of RNA polymerase II transcription subunit 13 n=1 Tax=Bremia lactucae TaxID=4779 RepID=A0A976IJ00_BRELC|nr:hypothetical protein CCR75_008883 [Bremia lactucae]